MKSSIKWFDYQVIWHYHLIISDSAKWKRLQNVYSQMKHTRLKPLSQVIWQPPPLHPVSGAYQPSTHRRLLAFPVCGFIIEEFEGFLDVRNIVSLDGNPGTRVTGHPSHVTLVPGHFFYFFYIFFFKSLKGSSLRVLPTSLHTEKSHAQKIGGS